MKYSKSLYVSVVFIIAAFLLIPFLSLAQDTEQECRNPELCQKMIRYGKQAYWRGKYLDAKSYFRKAVKADPQSQEAWSYYDLATVFALAEKVEQNQSLIAPGTSKRKEFTAKPEKKEAPPKPEPAPSTKKKKGEEKDIEFTIIQDEGC